MRVDVLNCKRRLLRNVRRDVYNAQCSVAHSLHQGVKLWVVLVGCGIEQGSDLRTEKWLGLYVLANLNLLQTRENYGQIAIRHLENLENTRSSTYAVHIVRCRGLNLRIALKHSTQQTITCIYGTHKGDALLTTHRNRSYSTREEYRVTKREDWKNLWKFDILNGVIIIRDDRNRLKLAVSKLGWETLVVKKHIIIFLCHSHLALCTR